MYTSPHTFVLLQLSWWCPNCSHLKHLKGLGTYGWTVHLSNPTFKVVGGVGRLKVRMAVLTLIVRLIGKKIVYLMIKA